MTSEHARILVIDDEESMCDFMEIMLSREGHEVDKTDSGNKAVELSNQESYDLIIADLMMPEMSGDIWLSPTVVQAGMSLQSVLAEVRLRPEMLPGNREMKKNASSVSSPWMRSEVGASSYSSTVNSRLALVIKAPAGT